MNARYKVCPQCPDRINSDWPNGLSMPVWSYRSFPAARKFAEKEAMSYTFGLVIYDVEKQRIFDGERWVPAEDFGKNSNKKDGPWSRIPGTDFWEMTVPAGSDLK